MEIISKQIESQAKPVKENMNRYEKSLAILNSAINLIDSHTDEYLEAMVEIARNKRLLAVNKKCIRGIWRQDAEEIDQLIKNENVKELNKIAEKKKETKAEVEGESEIKSESKDQYMNYQSEAIKKCVEIFENESWFE
jgi:hypothetical protein